MRVPFLRPEPPALSEHISELQAIETSGVFSNFGPLNTRLEDALTERIFGGLGGCLTTNCATTGLMIAVREAARPGRKYALMPSFTFAATAHAAIWAGLTPLFCDIDRDTWAMSERSSERILDVYKGQIACVVPYAPFGNCVDLEFYQRIAREHDVGVVVDAAASLGSLDEAGAAFGTGFPHAVVFSMHATKLFATAEAGVIHCGDIQRLERLRAMSNFGFAEPRVATMIGLNAKLSEIGALLGLARLDRFDGIVASHVALAESYKTQLPNVIFQTTVGQRVPYIFMPILLPPDWAPRRAALVEAMTRRGIGVRHYFSPHLAEQPYFAGTSESSDLTTTQDIADRVLSLPMSDAMTDEEILIVCTALREAIEEVS